MLNDMSKDESSRLKVIIGAVVSAIVLMALCVGGWYAAKNWGSVTELLLSVAMNEAFLLVGLALEVLDYASTHTLHQCIYMRNLHEEMYKMHRRCNRIETRCDKGNTGQRNCVPGCAVGPVWIAF